MNEISSALTPKTTHVLYLHGFRSSPQSVKARQMQQYVQNHQPQVHWWCPQLPPSPALALQIALKGTANWPQPNMAVIGSSLGGYYASAVAQQRCCPSILINPATHPGRDLARYIGENTLWHAPQEHFFFKPEYIDELNRMQYAQHSSTGPELLIAAQGDEVLDWREMLQRYPKAQLLLLEKSNHAVTEFEEHIPAIAAFLGWSSAMAIAPTAAETPAQQPSNSPN